MEGRRIIWCGVWLLLALMTPAAQAWGSPGKVLLRDVQVITLKQGRMTTGRRSTVEQLKCVGGSAHGRFNPQVVQCYNRGWDGVDVQWECKASDMENLYRFGEVEVVCEGYDYADDPYVTKGSCGLEYTLEYTQEGRENKRSQDGWGQSWFGGGSHQSSNSQYYRSSQSKGKWTGLEDLLWLGGIAFVIYVIYKTCIGSGHGDTSDRQYSSTDYPGGGSGGGGGGGGGGWINPGQSGRPSAPPADDNASCGGDRFQQRRQPGTGGGGWWSGLATGGLLGYLFGGGGGNRGYYGYGGGYRRTPYRSEWGSGYRTGGMGTSGFSSTTSSTSSGTRTASGFGGTRRR